MRIRVYVSGQVQGVGYRNFTRQAALKLGLNGWVRNLADGRVEALLDGDEAQIQVILTQLKNGPALAKVQNISIEPDSSSDILSGFEFRRA